MDGRRKKSRGRTEKHKGVVLYSRTLPSGATAWRARFLDPDSQKKVHVTLPANRAATEIQRTAWAIEKADEIKDRVKALEKGAPLKKGGTLREAVAQYFKDVANLSRGTLRGYQDATSRLLDWTDEKRIRVADELRGEHLAAFRAALVNKAKRSPKKGVRRYGHEETGRRRSPWTVNRELRAVKTALEHLRRLGLVPMLSKDAITDNLANLPAPRPVPEYMKPKDLAKLFEAAGRHDTETWDLTRNEKLRGLKPGEGATPCYAPILPYLAVTLLCGMRADEARTLRWERVDFDAEPSGTITLKPEDTKTGHGRIVELFVSPVLRELLLTMKSKAGDATYLFGDAKDKDGTVLPALTPGDMRAAFKRLTRKDEEGYGAPRFSPQRLRVTCATFLCNATGIYGSASAYKEAKQLGHSVVISEKHYAGVVHVLPEAKTLEAAMAIEKTLREVLRLGEAAPSAAKASV